MNFRFTTRFFILVFTFLLATNAFAQDTGNLSGTVTDPNGAVLAGATVKVVSIANGGERTVVANNDGIFTIQQLQPGAYRITVTQAGFKTTQVDTVELGVGQTRSLDLILQTGDVSAVVDVTSDEISAASIDQSSNRLGTNISAKEVEQLPVNGRNYSQLYLNAPGATNAGSGNFGDLRFQRTR